MDRDKRTFITDDEVYMARLGPPPVRGAKIVLWWQPPLIPEGQAYAFKRGWWIHKGWLMPTQKAPAHTMKLKLNCEGVLFFTGRDVTFVPDKLEPEAYAGFVADNARVYVSSRALFSEKAYEVLESYENLIFVDSIRGIPARGGGG